MLRHIVLITFRPDATAADLAAFREALAQIRDTVPEIRGFITGDNVGKGPNHHDFAIVADFDDLAAFRRYIASPQHKAYVEGPAKAVAKIAAIQHEW